MTKARQGLPAYRLTRRKFMGIAGAGVVGGALIVACGDDDDDEPAPTQVPAATQPAGNGQSQGATEGTVLVKDVIEHALSSDEWAGDFGFVTFRLHTGSVDDEPVYFIRTDASDQDFATEEGLVFAPIMAKGLEGDGAGVSAIYLFDGGTPDQTPVLSSAPHLDTYSPAFRVHRVSFSGTPERLGSVTAIEEAASAGTVEVEETDIVVNYPVVKWPGGELPVDDAKEAYLGGGQLISPVDVEGETVTFKLHACYTTSRYIVTDVTMPPMATGMNIAPSPAAAALMEAGATAEILVFGSGVEGNGPMGFQKSITDTNAGDPEWSPFWDHYTFLWASDATPEVLKSPGALQTKEEAGEIERVAGTPDTNGQLFMVNCPVPVVAPLA
jgi:hypothetical protein